MYSYGKLAISRLLVLDQTFINLIDLTMDISTEIYHLQDSGRYASEKPYTMRYRPEAPLASTNVVRERKAVNVTDIRGHEDEYRLDKHGFIVSKLATKMAHEDYDSHDKITNVYLKELEAELSNHVPGSEIDFVTYLVGAQAWSPAHRCSPVARSESERHPSRTRPANAILSGSRTLLLISTLRPLTWSDRSRGGISTEQLKSCKAEPST